MPSPQAATRRNSYIKHFRNGTSLDMSFKSTTFQTNSFASYRDWRKACNYTKEQNGCFVDLISTNSKQFTFEQVIEKFNKCIEFNISPNDMLIAMLYLSCHHFSPHCTSLIRYILNHYYIDINLYVTSVSSPQYKIPHVAAMVGDISLLKIYYNLNGDINVLDGRGVYTISVAIAERHLQFCETLLWLNSNIPIKQLSMLHERSMDDIIPFIAAFINFVNIIDKCKECISNQVNIPNELIDILFEYTLPINSYNGINQLLQSLKSNKLSEWDKIEQMAIDKLNIDKESRDDDNTVTIGINNEKELRLMTRMITNIHLAPTRIEGRVQYRDNGNNIIQQALKLTLWCSFAATSTAIIWRQRG